MDHNDHQPYFISQENENKFGTDADFYEMFAHRFPDFSINANQRVIGFHP